MHEAIIDMDTWTKVQDLLKRRTRNLDLNTNMSIFAGFLKCGDCGRGYCTPHHAPLALLETIILDDLNTIIQSVDNLQKIVERNKTVAINVKKLTNDEKKRLSSKLERVQKLKKSIYEDYREELISKEEFVAYRQDYLKKEEQLTKQLENIEEQRNTETTPDIFDSPWIKRLLELRRNGPAYSRLHFILPAWTG